MKVSALLLSLPLIHANHDHEHGYDEYFVSTWIMTALLILFYFCIIIAAFPYTRPRINFFVFFLLVLLPPVFFLYIFYLFIILILLTPPNTVQEEVAPVGQLRRVPRSRLEMSRV